MATTKTISTITVDDIADYLRIAELSEEDEDFIEVSLQVAKDYITRYTGISDLDDYTDMVIVVYVLCQDMYDNRTLYVDKSTMNSVVETILNMHARNLL